MEEMYKFGVDVAACVFSGIFALLVIHLFYVHARAFVTDTRPVRPFWARIETEDTSYDLFDGIFSLFALLVGAIVVSFTWPMALFICIVSGTLLFLRKMFRFQKAYEEHTHDPNTGKLKQ